MQLQKTMQYAKIILFFISNLDAFYISFLSNFFWFELPKLLHIEVVNAGILVLFLILEEKLSLSPLNIMLAVSFHIWLSLY